MMSPRRSLTRMDPALVADKNGADTDGAAAKVMFLDRLRNKVRPGTFGNIKVG